MRRPLLLLLVALLASTGCTSLVANLAADALGGSSAFASEDDPQLVREAIPFGLKTIDSLLGSAPENDKLLLAACAGYAQYAYAFVLQDAELNQDSNPALSKAQYARAKRLLARSRDYGVRGLRGVELNFKKHWPANPDKALKGFSEDDVPLLYWTAASWALYISLSKDDMNTLGELPLVEKLMATAYAIDPDFDSGSIHEFYINYDGGRSEALGGSLKKAQMHYDRVMQLTSGKKLGPKVTWAELVCVQKQDRKCFNGLLDEVLKANVDEEPGFRLVNIIAQNRARWLKGRADDLFVED